MNKQRRKELNILGSKIKKVKNQDEIYECIGILENIRDDEQDYYDNIPENLQCSQRAEDSEQAIENMEEALELLEGLYGEEEFDESSIELEDVIEYIENAQF